MTVLLLDPLEAAGLRAFLRRLLALDVRAAVRCQAGGRVLGVWAGPPMDVVALRPVALRDPLKVDVTVSAQRLDDRLASADAGRPLDLPGAVAGGSWAGLLPPRGGWAPGAVVPASVVADAVRVGVEAFRRRSDALAQDDRAPAVLEAAAAEVWERPAVGEVPLRVAHAAQLLGLLPPDGSGECAAYTSPAWVRLGCPGGSVATRRGPAARSALSLSVLLSGP